jgi:hypothetical protein
MHCCDSGGAFKTRLPAFYSISSMYFFNQKINDKKPIKQAVNTLLGIGLFLADKYCKDLLRCNQLGTRAWGARFFVDI